MNWTKEELIMVIGYYKLYGNDIKNPCYIDHVTAFSKIQNREFKSAKNTFKMKLHNIEAFENNDHKNDGNLLDNEEFYFMFVQNIDKTMSHFEMLMQKFVIKDENLGIKTFSIKKTKQIVNKIDLSKFAMQPKAEVDYESMSLKKYINAIKDRDFKVPLFQRKISWSLKDTIEFLNAMLQGFPFGNVTAWVSDSNALEERNEVIIDFAESKVDKSKVNSKWIIDGQQRTTAIISFLLDEIDDENRIKNVIFSFNDGCFKKLSKEDINYMYASDFLNTEIDTHDLMTKYKLSPDDIIKIFSYRKEIFERKVGITTITNSDIDTAIKIFTDMNIKGKKLSVFDIVNAKLMETKTQFNLEKTYEMWTTDNNNRLYIDGVSFVKTLYTMIDKDCIKASDILKRQLTADKFSDILVNKYLVSMTMAYEFLVHQMKFKPELLPSINLFRFLSYAFYINDLKFSASLNKKMIEYIKLVCINNFYSSSTDAKMEKNIKHIDKMSAEDNYDPKTISDFKLKDLSDEDLIDLKYNSNSSQYLYILNLLFRKAKSLHNNMEIPVYTSSKNSKTASINIHHIIPITCEFEGKKISENKYANSIINLAPILEEENQSISNNYPSVYYGIYKSKNDDIDKTLADLKINSIFIQGITQNSSEKECEVFWENRLAEIKKLLKEEVGM